MGIVNVLKINMGNNEIRNLISYEDIIKMKLYGTKNPIITTEEYLSMLFNNLGYNCRPGNFDEIKYLVPIDQISLYEDLVFPKIDCKNLILPQDKTTLKRAIEVIYNWMVDDIERGHLLDLGESFILPPVHEIKFNIKHNINMNRTGKQDIELSYWNKSDIIKRRLYNITPKVDEEYFNKCIMDFDNIIKKVEVYCPWIIFISCLINPDLFFNAIRTAEKTAFDTVYESVKEQCPYPILIKDNQLVKEFEKNLNMQIAHLVNIYQKRGYTGLIIPVQSTDPSIIISAQLPINMETYTTLGTDVALNQSTIDHINKQIFGTTLDGDHKSYILQYVDANSLDILNNLGENSIVRKNSYKKLYYTIMQIKESAPELLNRKEKFIFSAPFYVNQEIFALYHKQRNTFFITYPDLVLREMSPKKAIEFYKTYLNINVSLDSKEMIDSYDSLPVPYIDLKALDEQGIYNNTNTSDHQQENNQSTDSIESEPLAQEEKSTDNEIPEFVNEDKEQEYVGYDINDAISQ